MVRRWSHGRLPALLPDGVKHVQASFEAILARLEALNRTNVNVQDLTVRAALTGEREAV